MVYTDSCGFKTKSNVVFDSRKTSAASLLNQVKLSEVGFYQGCYNCPSRIEILDSLVIKRPQDKFYTEFAIEGYNEELKTYMVNKLSQSNKNIPSNKWEALSWLDELNATQLNKLTQTTDFKRKAIATYQLKNKPSSYTIALK